MGCNYLYLPLIPVSGTHVLNFWCDSQYDIWTYAYSPMSMRCYSYRFGFQSQHNRWRSWYTTDRYMCFQLLIRIDFHSLHRLVLRAYVFPVSASSRCCKPAQYCNILPVRLPVLSYKNFTASNIRTGYPGFSQFYLDLFSIPDIKTLNLSGGHYTGFGFLLIWLNWQEGMDRWLRPLFCVI